jgi:hypothetical protein
MIDTLKLKLQDYVIDKSVKLILEPSPIEYETQKELNSHILYRDAIHTISGKKAYINTSLYNIDLQQSKNGSPALYLQTSIPKVINGKNYSPTALNELQTAFKKIEKDLKGIGIITNIYDAKLSRIDLFKNVPTKEPFASYRPVFETLSMNRMSKRDYGTAFLFYNTYAEMNIYDKLVEMQKRNESIDGLPNTARTELRLLKARKIQNSLDMITPSDLQKGFEYLPEFYNSYLATNIFKYGDIKENENVLSSDCIDNLLNESMKDGRLSISKLMKLSGMTVIMPNERRILDAVSKRAENKMQITRIKRQIERLKQSYMRVTKVKGHLSINDLYIEFRDKVLSKVC